ncbi:hypothetical protein PLESTB_000098400 [Pleodorina starrii]|uniref:Uncharacterized protein n=1 Tax=Pleodorina starrii TaxID=330485 RepID=A0A9W6BB13_9CHLO|nr:hypothetical protein PLESTM_000094900 [Pleodorina starrii]GLC36289.1 hypothetical protein PLESTM_000427700 [Pleodorina starrii]GLC48443.1 hypothetical protein PLESTB_000098400 [Pleodorina starrii]GLC64916.1 hypothetical protein PLESTF_000221500 [Pleodorina starrii]GLC71764.1 hypothetical protein PLESTF_001164100 [Pleodorina starrii]
MGSPSRSPKSGKKGNKRTINSPGREEPYISKAQKLDAQVVARRQELRAEATAASQQAAMEAAQNATTLQELKGIIQSFCSDFDAKLARHIGLMCRKILLLLGFDSSLIDQLEEQGWQAAGPLPRDQFHVPPHAPPPPPPPPPLVLHPDRLLLEVPVACVADTAKIVEQTLATARPGARINFDVMPRTPKAPATGGGGRARPETRLVDVYMMPSSRKSLATLGGELFRRHGIVVRDALTRAGVELRRQRYATYARLREEQKRPRWENGVDVSYVNQAGVRMLYTGPWDGPAPSGPQNNGNGGSGGSGSGTGAGGGAGSAVGGAAGGVPGAPPRGVAPPTGPSAMEANR